MSQARNFADLLASGTTITSDKLDDNAIHGQRNLIINGAMQVAQRGTSVTSQTSTAQYHTVDRFLTETSGGTYDAEQSTTAPNGFSYSLKVTIDGAFTPTSSQHIIPFEYRIEGQDLQRLAYGTSDAKSVTLSFWIRSSKTGTYVVELSNFNSTQSRKYSKQYTIDVADTWEYKTITWEGDTVRAFENNNGLEAVLYWWMTAGTDFTSGTIPSGWENSTNANRAVGVPTSLADNEEFYLTGVQLEVGEATPFEHRSYGDELARCQRYFQNDIFVYEGFENDTELSGVAYYKQTMRAAPTLSSANVGGNATTLTGLLDRYQAQCQWWLNFGAGTAYTEKLITANAEL